VVDGSVEPSDVFETELAGDRLEVVARGPFAANFQSEPCAGLDGNRRGSQQRDLVFDRYERSDMNDTRPIVSPPAGESAD
jgi:hypothetical protein